MQFVVQVEVHPKGWLFQEVEQLEKILHARRLTSETHQLMCFSGCLHSDSNPCDLGISLPCAGLGTIHTNEPA